MNQQKSLSRLIARCWNCNKMWHGSVCLLDTNLCSVTLVFVCY